MVSTPLDGESKYRHHQEIRNAMFWPYCFFLDMCGSGNSCGNQVAWGDHLCGHTSHFLPKPWFSSTTGVGVGFYRLKWKLSLSCFQIQCVPSMNIHMLEMVQAHDTSVAGWCEALRGHCVDSTIVLSLLLCLTQQLTMQWVSWDVLMLIILLPGQAPL